MEMSVLMYLLRTEKMGLKIFMLSLCGLQGQLYNSYSTDFVKFSYCTLDHHRCTKVCLKFSKVNLGFGQKFHYFSKVV